jgi:hypothetical protein
MEHCSDRWQCQGGELIAAAAVPESSVSERIPIVGWVSDDECECECSGTETKCKFQFSRFQRSEFETVDRCGQLDAATIKFWKCTWRRRRKWTVKQLSTAGGRSRKIHGPHAVIHVTRRSKRWHELLGQQQQCQLLHSKSDESKSRQWSGRWSGWWTRRRQRRWRLSKPG